MAEQPEQSPKKVEIPPSLLQGLQKIESSGVVPLLIPQVLEDFLTRQGIYRSSMTPADAWEALQALYAETRPTPPPAQETETPASQEVQPAIPTPAPTASADQTQPQSSPDELEQLLRQQILSLGRYYPTARVSLYKVRVGVYSVVFRIRQRRGRLSIYLTCDLSYPQTPPAELKLELERPGRSPIRQAYQAKIFDSWKPAYTLIEVVNEVLEAV